MNSGRRAATADTPLKVYVGGNTAGFEDVTDKVAARLPLFISLVIGLSVLLLVVAFRSLWIPLVSAVFNLLSVAAAYGVVVAVFQEGIGASLIGADSGVPIISFLPVMLFAILFGLSMDYNVFLLSRIREAYNGCHSPRESVILGIGRIGKVVVFAGLIMSGVFLGFVTQNDVIGKMFGLGLGLAILIDVLIVRMVVAPAVVTLLGHRAWWLPAALDRALPNVSLEGHRGVPAARRETITASSDEDGSAGERASRPASDGQRIDVVSRGDRVDVSVHGELTVDTATDLARRLAEVERAQPATLVLDLRELRFLDSTGLSELVRAHQRARSAGRRLILVKRAGPIERILAISGLAEEFETTTDVPPRPIA
jgi:anti-anti-sigma factor